MISSMMAGISGLKVHQTRMDVIANNIANVNTAGYKASRVTFREIYSRTLTSATAPDPETGIGGTNPSQIGLGVGLNAITLNYTNGSIETTDNPLDVAIDGNGFFIAKTNPNGEFLFTRAGSFGVDKLGNLVTADGAQIYGWLQYAETEEGYTYNTESQVEAINLYTDTHNGTKKILEPQATSFVTFTGNLNLNNDPGIDGQIGIPISIYDSYGTEYTAQIVFSRSGDPTDPDYNANEWEYEIQDGNGGKFFDTIKGTIEFDNTDGNEGKVKSLKDENGDEVDDFALETAITFVGGNKDTLNVKFNFDALTQFSADTSAKVYSSNGYTSGELVDYSIGEDGVITGVYSNGKQQPLARIAMAVFDNPQGLRKVGGSMYAATTNSGDFIRGIEPHTTAGSLVSNALELSNVDLSTEFTDMIITQRGFQANSKIINTSDELLQELVNLKR